MKKFLEEIQRQKILSALCMHTVPKIIHDLHNFILSWHTVPKILYDLNNILTLYVHFPTKFPEINFWRKSAWENITRTILTKLNTNIAPNAVRGKCSNFFLRQALLLTPLWYIYSSKIKTSLKMFAFIVSFSRHNINVFNRERLQIINALRLQVKT
jgi:hypothetical protein